MQVKNSLIKSIIVIFVVFNSISALAFAYYTNDESQNNVEKYARNSLQEIAKEKSEIIGQNFGQVETNAKMLGTYMENVLHTSVRSVNMPKDYVISGSKGIIERKGTGYKGQGDAGDLSAKDKKSAPGSKTYEKSNMIVPYTKKKERDIFNDISQTEKLDPFFSRALKTDNVTWVYIATRNNLLRVSPFTSLTVFEDRHNQTADVFYKAANRKNNPERKTVWTKPYKDYLDKGWTITCSQPIYDRKDRFYGVICLDIAIDRIRKQYFDEFNIGKGGNIYWINKDGLVLYGDYKHEADKSRHGDVRDKNIFDGSDLGKVREDVLKQALRKGNFAYSYTVNGMRKTLVAVPMKNPDSILAVELNQKELLSMYSEFHKSILFWFAINLTLALLLARFVSRTFSSPLRALLSDAEKISNGKYDICEDSSKGTHFYEIQQLHNGFVKMGRSIEKYTGELKAQKREIESILEVVDGTMMIVDRHGKILVSPQNKKKLPIPSCADGACRAIENGVPFSEKIKTDGGIFEVKYYPIMDEKDEASGKVVISIDNITENVIEERELLQIEKMAGVGQLAAAIVHELKNSLALIKGATYILDRTGEENKAEIETIKSAADEAGNVIETLLDYSRQDVDGGDMVHVETIIRQIFLLSKKQMINKNLSFRIEIREEVYLYSKSRETIKVVMQNIIENAIQASRPDGEILISCKEIGSNLAVRVENSGDAIKPEQFEKIFEPFFTTKKDGNGLGLWISRELIESMGGKVHVLKSDSVSTVFEMLMPIVKE